jgi:hypothetical protein
MAVDGHELRGNRARHHEPFGVAVGNMIARRRQLAPRDDERHVDPGMHNTPRRMRLQERLLDRIELGLGPGVDIGAGPGRTTC